MSIGPVQYLDTMDQNATGTPPPRWLPQDHPTELAPLAQPGSGNVPRPEAQTTKSSSTAPRSQEDEVELLRDSGPENELIFRYVDKSGKVVFQVPSEQLLDVERAFAEEIRRAEAHRASIGTRERG